MHDLFDLLGIKGPVWQPASPAASCARCRAIATSCREMIASPICGALAAAYLTLPVVVLFQGDRPADPRSGRRHHDARRRLSDRRLRHVDLRHRLRGDRAAVQGDRRVISGGCWFLSLAAGCRNAIASTFSRSKKASVSKMCKGSRRLSENSVDQWFLPMRRSVLDQGGRVVFRKEARLSTEGGRQLVCRVARARHQV